MQVIGIVGASGSGKTTLIAALVPILKRRGLRVSTIKHAHHGFDIDRSGKDSFVHRESGAEEVMVASAGRWALMREEPGRDDLALAELLNRMTPVDIVLVEGFRNEPIPQIEVYRPRLGKPPFFPRNTSIVAIASDEPLLVPLPLLSLNAPERIADSIASFVREMAA